MFTLSNYLENVEEFILIVHLDYKSRLDVSIYTGDIGDTQALRKAFHNVSAVLHVASVIDVQFQPDRKLLRKVNVEGKCQHIWRI